MSEVVREMYLNATRILTNPDQDLGALVEETLRREDVVDTLEKEITEILNLVARAATSASAARHIGEMALNTHRLERIGDHCEKLIFLAVRNHESLDNRMDQKAIDDLVELSDLVDEALDNLGAYLTGDADIDKARELENAIDKKRDDLRDRHIKRIQNEQEQIVPGLHFLDALHNLEEIGDRVYGIVMRAEETKLL